MPHSSPRAIALAAATAVVTSFAVAPSPTSAQLIPIRTVPVASGDQFRLLPSLTMGMGGVTYAVDDSLADGWSQPAKGGRAPAAFIGSPTFYDIADDRGAGRTFPVAGLFRADEWFGGASVALQQIENTDGASFFWGGPALDVCCIGCCGGARPLSEIYGRNLYASGYVGRRLADGPWTVGLGVSVAALDAMDGVDLLYAGSDRIEQDGTITDVRVGAYREGPQDRLSLLLAHDRVSMEHDVTWTDWTWVDSLQMPVTERRVETNQDQTRTWAAQVGWDRRLEAPGWRIGLSGTVNRKTHPKIPNYVIQNIPRDPGESWAYELGFGFSVEEESTLFALDLALQPIWSNTWQVADSSDVDAAGGLLEEGDRSIENDFFFTNVLLRTGVSHGIGALELQGGLEVRSYDYELEQVDRVEGSVRDQEESWIEWSPTFGAAYALSKIQLRYGLRVTKGTGRPGLAGGVLGRPEALAAADADFLLAPGGALTLQETRVVTHQISVTIPVR